MGKSSGESSALQSAQTNLANIMATTGEASALEGATLFNMALPGLEKAESYYGKLSSGDPNALARANAPAIQQVTEQSNSAKNSILQNNPRGGERNLALEEADISKGAQISNLTTSSYLQSFPSLASLGGQNVSAANSATGTGVQSMNAAANQYGNIQQLNNEQKATQLGFISSLAGAGASLGASFCYVAAALYGGWNAPDTVRCRIYLYNHWRNHFILKWPYRAYGRYGKIWSEYVKVNSFWRLCARSIFSVILRRAIAEERMEA